MSAWTFFVPGIPQSRGSKNAFPIKRKDGSIGVAVADDNPKSKAWMSLVAMAAERTFAGNPPLTGPVRVAFEFIMPRPLSHFGSGRNAATLKPSAPQHHTQAPDWLKLARGTEDALKGIAWRDDAQNCQIGQPCGKRWAAPGERPGCLITIEEIEEAPRAGKREPEHDPGDDGDLLLF